MSRVRKWQGQAAQDALADVKRLGRRRNTPCCICHRAIDYDLPSSHPMGCSVQHVKSRSLHPELTWVKSNWKPAHLKCNKVWGAKDLIDVSVENRGPARATSGW